MIFPSFFLHETQCCVFVSFYSVFVNVLLWFEIEVVVYDFPLLSLWNSMLHLCLFPLRLVAGGCVCADSEGGGEWLNCCDSFLIKGDPKRRWKFQKCSVKGATAIHVLCSFLFLDLRCNTKVSLYAQQFLCQAFGSKENIFLKKFCKLLYVKVNLVLLLIWIAVIYFGGYNFSDNPTNSSVAWTWRCHFMFIWLFLMWVNLLSIYTEIWISKE